jgi:uncharacterized phage protein (TIGR01671 family)
MREFKFRAWDEQNKIMHYDFQFIKSGNEGNDWIIFTSDKQFLSDSHHPFQNPYFQQQFKIMEWTGTKDKNDKYIYEGDVISIDEHWSGDYRIPKRNYIVELHSPEYSCKAIGVNEWEELDWNNKYIEVVGNIFENPELLEGK